jgi:hypothetical protein
MKKIIIILALALASCSTDSGSATADCRCGVAVESSSFNVAGPNGVVTFTVLTMKNNCTGVFKQIQRDGTIPNGTQLCDY